LLEDKFSSNANAVSAFARFIRAPSLPYPDSSLFGFLSLKMFDTSFRAELRLVLESANLLSI
jgi:hypothetical protein